MSLHYFEKIKKAIYNYKLFLVFVAANGTADIICLVTLVSYCIGALPPILKILCCLVNRGTVSVNSLPKTVTRQRRGCDLNP